MTPLARTLTAEVLDPRTDPEPAYWPELRTRAGLRADWAWPVLATQSWSDRCPHLVTVLHDDSGPVAAVNAGWLGFPGRWRGFLPVGATPKLGLLHVRGPGSSAVPGWSASPDGVGLLLEYQRAMRARLGMGLAGTVLRQLTPDELSRLGKRAILARITEPIWQVDTSAMSSVDDWLKTLDKKRRSNLRVIARKLADRVTVTATPGDSTAPADITDLIRRNNAKYQGLMHNPVPQLTGYVAELTAQPDVITFRYTDPGTGKLMGVGILMDHPEIPVWRTWAMVPVDDGGVRDLYFLHMSRLIEWVTQNNRPTLLLGKGKGRLKSSVGATSIDQYAALIR